MDFSKEYILMCEKAQEIQKLRNFYKDYNDGDFYYNNILEIDEVNVFNVNDFQFSIRNKNIWLPRQDQLQEMIINNIKKELDQITSLELLSPFNLFINNIETEFETEDKLQTYIICRYTMEQLWLMYVMKENYNKIWSEKQQDWILN